MDLSTAAAENAARTSYGRLLAVLASSDGDIVAAEDALSDAFERALTTWPRDGIPANPDGWLLTAARNKRRDVWKSAANRTSVPLDPVQHAQLHIDDVDVDAIPDKRLELMSVCAHPDVDSPVRTPLMLDVVLGYTAKDIARAFAIPASTMAARLGRAKKRIQQTGAQFSLPDRADLPSRLESVQAAVYGAFAIDMSREALYLAEILCTLLPDDAEAHGLAALICLSSAREQARYVDDVMVPLPQQDIRRWDAELIARGEEHLRLAHDACTRGSPLGRYQLEAAIDAVHCARRRTGVTDWRSLAELHAALQTVAPTIGGAVAHAVVIAETDSPETGLAILDAIPGAERFQPAWAARAHLLATLGRPEAKGAFAKSISLTPDIRVRRYLEGRSA